jgi:hypothetical protein
MCLLTYDRLATEIIKDFVAIDPETQPRNVAAWTPVVVDILQGCIGFEDAAVSSARQRNAAQRNAQ